MILHCQSSITFSKNYCGTYWSRYSFLTRIFNSLKFHPTHKSTSFNASLNISAISNVKCWSCDLMDRMFSNSRTTFNLPSPFWEKKEEHMKTEVIRWENWLSYFSYQDIDIVSGSNSDSFSYFILFMLNNFLRGNIIFSP